MPNILIVGGTRGLGAALVTRYSSQPKTTVYATTRSSSGPDTPALTKDNIKWIVDIDLTKSNCGSSLVSQLSKSNTQFSTVYITAGIFKLESFDKPDWEAEVATYTTSAIAPVFLVSALFHAGLLPKQQTEQKSSTTPTKIILVSSEAGSLTLSSAGGGGNYAHHASKSAMNMAGLQLHYDLKPHGIAVVLVHPSFMRTEMTKGVGFDVAWDENDALTPEQAAGVLGEWTDQKWGMERSGEFWAPRGSRDIGSWKDVVGQEVKGPAKLPW